MIFSVRRRPGAARGGQRHPRRVVRVARVGHQRHVARIDVVVEREIADEAAVARFYDGLENLWASIHIAGAFAGGSI